MKVKAKLNSYAWSVQTIDILKAELDQVIDRKLDVPSSPAAGGTNSFVPNITRSWCLILWKPTAAPFAVRMAANGEENRIGEHGWYSSIRPWPDMLCNPPPSMRARGEGVRRSWKKVDRSICGAISAVSCPSGCAAMDAERESIPSGFNRSHLGNDATSWISASAG